MITVIKSVVSIADHLAHTVVITIGIYFAVNRSL